MSNLTSQCSTFVEILRIRSEDRPEKIAFTYLDYADAQESQTSISYSQLDQMARSIAAVLQSYNLVGQRVLLIYSPGIEFIAAFFGCMYAGAIAVPVYPPSPRRPLQYLEQIIKNCYPSALMTSMAMSSVISQRFSQNTLISSLLKINTDENDYPHSHSYQEFQPRKDLISHVQFTSGSTGSPKGVVLTHNNLIYNSELIYKGFGHTSDLKVVSWLPVYHDMGLIGNVLQPVFAGGTIAFMSPQHFIQQPLRWLKAISTFEGTTSGGPNFAYELCIRKVKPEQIEQLTLQSWNVAFSGAETVRSETLEKFSEIFAPCGFLPESFYPCYGMAEATLMITGGNPHRKPKVLQVDKNSLENGLVNADLPTSEVGKIVSCGSTFPGHQVKIVNPDTFQLCVPNMVGEIWASGPSIGQGYYGISESVGGVFSGYLSDSNEGPFLRTGDLGFLYEEELYVTGRLKDLIIIRGRNHYPQDLEWTSTHSHKYLQVDSAAAFSIEINGEEQLVVVQEIERSYLRKLDVEEVSHAIIEAISHRHEIQPYAVVLTKPGIIPKTTSGKIQRVHCRKLFLEGNLSHIAQKIIGVNNLAEKPSLDETIYLPNTIEIQNWVKNKISERLKMKTEDIDPRDSFDRYRLDSLAAIELTGELGEWLGRSVSPTLIYDYPSIEALACHLSGEQPGESNKNLNLTAGGISIAEVEEEAIAIIGMGCRFPGAENLESYWHLLRSSGDAIQEIPRSRWDTNYFSNSESGLFGKINLRWGGFLDQVEHFDPQFFEISPREAELMDPQQRLLLEVSWEALENAGQAPEKLEGSQTGVFVGISNCDYSRLLMNHSSGVNAYLGTGNAFSVAANRLSYFLDLKGPSWAVDTACSSSLVALHQACQSLRHRECQLALAGGVNLILTPHLSEAFEQARMLAPDGRCKSFDVSADGYVRSEGCGIVILKRLSDALRDGDTIYAVVRGSAVNQDGHTNGLTAPNGPSQAKVIRQALDNAGIAPSQISYVEAHGTGTALGDPIEINALKDVLLQGRNLREDCWIGSVKANVGHLESAAGIASVIKTVLALQYKEIPPQLHFKRLNEEIHLKDTPMSIPIKIKPWSIGQKHRFAGVSSFGFSGTNAHIILEEAPTRINKDNRSDRPRHLLTLSAKSDIALRELADRYNDRLQTCSDSSLANVCFTANTGRTHFKYRAAVTASSCSEMCEQLKSIISKDNDYVSQCKPIQSTAIPKIAFMFTGQGSQYRGMGKLLYETQPTFRKVLEEANIILFPYLQISLFDILYPETAELSLIDKTAFTQPVLFAFEYALYKLWSSWGVEPSIVIGHSLGEYVAACVAGVFNFEDGLKLIAERARLMQSLAQKGRMAVIFADQFEVEKAIRSYQNKVSIAAINGVQNIVISGVGEAVQTICLDFEQRGILVRPLNVSHAFHSPQVDEILDDFKLVLSQISFQAPKIPLISNLTGQIFSSSEILDADYWQQHARNTVRFMAGLDALHEHGCDVFLEIGPKPTLSSFGRLHREQTEILWLSSIAQGRNDWDVLLNSLSALYMRGINIDWPSFDQDYSRHLIQLPTYPFQRKRYWINNEANSLMSNVRETSVENYRVQLREQILSEMCSTVGKLLKLPDSEIDVNTPFLEMGADSIVLIEAVRIIEDAYGIKISIRQLFESLTNLTALANYIEQVLAEENSSVDPIPSNHKFQIQQPTQEFNTILAEQVEDPNFKRREIEAPSSTEGIMKLQLDAMSKLVSQQLEVLQNRDLPNVSPSVLGNSSSKSSPSQFFASTDASTQVNGAGEKEILASEKNSKSNPPLPIHVPFQQDKDSTTNALNSQQQKHVESLISRYSQRTQKSKQFAKANRSVFADNRSVSGFRYSIKEMLYPIVGSRYEGSRFWDIDGNEYIDISMGFGVHLFGHGAPFISRAIAKQLERGIAVGPQPELAGEVAHLFCELTEMERVTFCQSGTEAVMMALRLARTATKRKRVAIFNGSYHGHYDGVLAQSNGNYGGNPRSPGVVPNSVQDVLVLEYGEQDALKILEEHMHELAAVLVEPVQSRRPNLQPREFLQELRELTHKGGAALIFDEIITGFRIHLGGAQKHFGIQADMATYGKVPGGGLPFAAVAGAAKYLNGIDGGLWNYGDSSYPQEERTFFAGTFNKPPLALATTRAVLLHLKEQGSKLQDQLNERTAKLSQTLNTYFEAEKIPIHVVYFGSLFRFSFRQNLDFLFYHLAEKGVYIWEGRTCFLSTAHTEEDIEKVIAAVKDSIKAMQKGGFFQKSTANISPTQDECQTINNSMNANERSNNRSLTNTIEHKNIGTISNSYQNGSEKVDFWERRKKSFSGSEQNGKKVLRAKKQMLFSLYYFGSYDAQSGDKYDLIFKGSKFADQHNFSAVWIPERHFHSFGGFSPNPSVIAAALARETKQIQIRAGSTVLPLHHPIRVAEEWSVVDNISGGRAGIAFASGWHSNDFVFSPNSYGNHREQMFAGIEVVSQLWKGETIQALDGAGKNIDIQLFPTPIQRELPIWLTIVNNPETYFRAGAIGAGVLTNLMGQSIEDLANNIAIYRQSLLEHGFSADSSKVTVLLHTFIGRDLALTREQARFPFYSYLRSSVGLFQNLVKSQGLEVDFDRLTEEDKDYVLEAAYERYVQTSALIGTPESCSNIIDRLTDAGVDEIGCFIDFGVDNDSVLEHLSYLNELRHHYQNPEAINTNLGECIPEIPEYNRETELIASIPTRTIPNDSANFSLTEAQKHLLLMTKLGEASSLAYNLSVGLKLQGPLNLAALTKAFQSVVKRHDSIRTSIDKEGEFQVITQYAPEEIPVVDLSQIAVSEQVTRVHEWAQRNSREFFKVGEEPLFRIQLLKLAEEQHLLFITSHHIVMDGWSMGIVLQDIGTFYSAECQGVECQLPSPTQFIEYVELQDKYSQSEEMKLHESYWLTKFSNSVPVPALPTDNPYQPIRTFNGDRHTFRLDKDFCENLRLFSQKQGCTLFMVLMAIYAVFLHRVTNQDDLVIGIPTAGRLFEGSEQLVGYCSHYLPIRSNILWQSSFLESLVDFRDLLLEAYEHQAYPFSSMINNLRSGRDFKDFPLISIAFNLERSANVDMFALEADLYPQPISFVPFDLNLNATEIGGAIVLDWDYNSDLFRRETIERIADNFSTLLEDVVTNPKQRIIDLQILSSSERQQVVSGFNKTEVDFPKSLCAHQLFEQQVEKTPDSIALVFEQQHLTYRQLNEQVNKLAHYLQSLGVGPDTIIGLCVGRSVEMVVGLLGILKAGGAYLPLDSSYPQERILFMLEDASVSIVLSDRSTLSIVANSSAQIVLMDELESILSPLSNQSPGCITEPKNLAYVISTSGSTGTPKSVMVEHQGFVNSLYHMQQSLKVENHDILLAITTIAFDIASLEILLPLSFGAKVILLAHTASSNPSLLAHNFNRYQEVTIMQTTPSTWRLLISSAWKATRPIKILCGGEALPRDLAEQILNFGCELWNVYGPTETTLWSTIHKVTRGSESVTEPIGHPISNAQIFVLDVQGNPTPIGVAGEITIGGVGVSRGYLNRPELTAEKFISNPFSENPGDKLYRTGDLGRWQADGQLEYLGRMDSQVKLRGFRIELGEIEAVLYQHLAVQHAAVMIRGELDDKQLIAYVVPIDETISLETLQEDLRTKLPEFMVPSLFVVLESLPLNINGKIDRKKLLEQEELEVLSTTCEYIPPQTPNQVMLVRIWSEVLDREIECIGIYTNFFELGGHSLLATQMIARLRDDMGIDLPLRTLFERPTIAALDEYLVSSQQLTNSSSINLAVTDDLEEGVL
jgi:iturin family lipopeptide synthetase A